MLKKIFFNLLILLSLFSTSSMALTLTTECSDPVIIDTSVLNDSTNFSYQILESSTALLRLSESILNNASTVNTEYVQAMLQLSQDIGTMADKIGEMADRILVTELQIGIMADRILETQNIQNENVALTQQNILQAQTNLNEVLTAN